MNCLSVRQPWASALVMGAKTVENRTWLPPKSAKQKRLLIHASKTPTEIPRWARTQLDAWGGLMLEDQLGVILGVVDLDTAERVEHCQLPWAEGPWCWLVSSPLVFREPIPCRGHLKVFEVPDSLIRAQLDRAIPPAEHARRQREAARLSREGPPRPPDPRGED